MTDEERKAIEYYTNNEYTFGFETDMDMEHFKKALGIEETEEDTFEKHQMRFKTLLNLINKQSKQIQEYKRLLERNEQLEKEKDILIKQGWLNE